MEEERVLRHAVGRSTLAEGFAIPRDFEEWVEAPPKGSKREVTLEFGDEEVRAYLRCLNNERGSVQVKYENMAGAPFRDWLRRVFGTYQEVARGDYIEVRRISRDRFSVTPVRADDDVPALQPRQWILHGGAEELLSQDTPLAELPAIVRTVPFHQGEDQSFYNQKFSDGFAAWSWGAELRAIPQLGLRCDFSKAGVLVEVEFGNAATYYQDFVKFLLGNRWAGIEAGVLVVPTFSFAQHLCDLGRQRAVAKGRRYYSGMISFDKVEREFEYLEFMLDMPIVVMGVSSSFIEGNEGIA